MNQVSLATGESSRGHRARRMSSWPDNVLGPRYPDYRSAGTWRPAINLYEGNSAYYMVVDLAGVRGEIIDLRVENGMLILSGERATPEATGVLAPTGAGRKTRVHLMEIDHGAFRRSLKLPDDVDVDRIEATYRCGLLWVRIPKRG